MTSVYGARHVSTCHDRQWYVAHACFRQRSIDWHGHGPHCFVFLIDERLVHGWAQRGGNHAPHQFYNHLGMNVLCLFVRGTKVLAVYTSSIHYWRPRLHSVKALPSVALLGKIFPGKGSLSSAFYWGTRQNKKQFCRMLGAALGKIFSAVAAPAVNGYFAECPTQRSTNFFFKFLCRVPQPRHSAIFFKSTLPSAPVQALGKVFFLFFLKKYFAECPCPGTRQSFFYFF